MQEMWVQAPSWDNALEEHIGAHTNILAGKSHGQRSLAGYSPCGHKEWDMNEATEHTHIDSLVAFISFFLMKISLSTVTFEEVKMILAAKTDREASCMR